MWFENALGGDDSVVLLSAGSGRVTATSGLADSKDGKTVSFLGMLSAVDKELEVIGTRSDSVF